MLVYIAAFNISFKDNKIYLSSKTQIAYLKMDEILIKLPSKDTDFANIFSLKLDAKLFKHININNHTIKLMDD